MIVNLPLSTERDFSLALYAFHRYQEYLIDLFNRQSNPDEKDDLRIDIFSLGNLITDLSQGLVEVVNEKDTKSRSKRNKAIIKRLRRRFKGERMAKYMS